MWIIPKTLSHFVPATEGLNLELDEQAWMLESSAMWRSKPSSKQTWLRRLNRNSWLTALSGRILKPSLHESFEEKYTDSLEDIPASPSVQQGSAKARMTQDTYGHISSSMSGQLDLFGVFGKTFPDTPRWGYGESCPIWKKKVTDARGAYSARKKLALHTKGNESSSLRNFPTPEAHTVEKYSLQKDGQKKTQRSRNLTAMAINGELSTWSTLQARDWKGAQGRAYKGEAKDLPAQTEMNWATPNTMDCLPSRSYEAMKRQATTGGRKNRKRPGNLREQIDPLMCQAYEDASKEANQQNWPTPRAGNPGSRKPGTGGKILAEEAKKNWGTPASNDANKTPHCEINSKQAGLSKSVGIEEAKKNWPTPLEDDSSNVNPSPKRRDGLVAKVVKHAGPPAPEKSSTSGKNQGSPKLNPNWVEQLMGLSTGWTDLGSWATELSPKQQN